MKPIWSRFSLEYPNYRLYPDSAAVKRNIGGHVDAAWITNTCAIRMSRGLNYSGVAVPSSFPGLTTVEGGDKKRYAFRVAEMRPWLRHTLGQPDFDQAKKAGEDFDKNTLSDRKGIIAFDIHFADATGHLDIWDGTVFSHEYAASDYWTRATRITLWNLP